MSVKKSKCLELKEKADILDSLQKGTSVTSLAKKYNVAKSTICSIKKKKEAILNCINNTYQGPGKRQTLKTSELPVMEKTLYRWFLRMRDRNWPVSGLMLKEKAKELHSQLKETESGFNASDGWLQRFKKRYGVELLKVSGEKLSSQPELVDPFKLKLKKWSYAMTNSTMLMSLVYSGNFYQIKRTLQCRRKVLLVQRWKSNV